MTPLEQANAKIKGREQEDAIRAAITKINQTTPGGEQS